MTAFYNKPWAPGYALPGYVKKEDPLTRGDAVTTSWLRRGTISHVDGLDKRTAGYSLPKYVLDEPVGSQAHTTPWLPNGTVMSMKSLKTGLPWKSNAHTLDSNGLGSLGDTTKGGSTVGGKDPIVQYGKKAAAVVAQTIATIPPGQREKEMRNLLNEVDPSLFSIYKKELGKFKSMGQSPANASKSALAVAFSGGLTKEFIKLGKARKAKKPGLRKGAVSLGALVGFDAQASNYQDLSGVTSTIRDGLNKLGGLACDVATNPTTPLVAGVAGAYYGGPAGASLAVSGSGIAAAQCSKGGAGAGYGIPAPSAMPSWALPAIIGGGGLALLLVLTRK